MLNIISLSIRKVNIYSSLSKNYFYLPSQWEKKLSLHVTPWHNLNGSDMASLNVKPWNNFNGFDIFFLSSLGIRVLARIWELGWLLAYLFWYPLFQGKLQYTRISTMNLYLLLLVWACKIMYFIQSTIESPPSSLCSPITLLTFSLRHNIHIQNHGNYIKVKKLKYMLEIDILRNFLNKNWGVWRGVFWGHRCPN